MTKIQVFEHQSISYSGRYAIPDFDEKHHQAFESYFQKNERTPYFDLIPKGVRFKSYVGVIQIGDTVIEVLPKADRKKKSSASKETWHNILLEMLRTCELLKARQSSNASLKLKRNSILELYFVLFLDELETLVKRGLIKKYKTHQSQQKSLKGALVFSEQIKRNLIHKERFFVQHETYDKNHLLHQILYETLLLIERLDTGGSLKDRIGRLLLDFPLVDSRKVNAGDFDRIKSSRKHEPYERALDIAKLLLLNFRPDLKAGAQNMIALMFDMNMLWEEYVYRVLRRELRREWEVHGQKRKRFWEKKVIKPDIVLRHRESGVVYVIDTKWKLPEKQKPSDNDLKQMFAYNHYWKCTHSLLLYPSDSTESGMKGGYSEKILINETQEDHFCSMGYLDLVEYYQNRDKWSISVVIRNMLEVDTRHVD